MSRFFSTRHIALQPYVPGEQPQNRAYIKLNTNESPFPPSAGVAKAVAQEYEQLPLYSDPECRKLREAMADIYGIAPSEVLMTNGSDASLFLAFSSFADVQNPLVFPDITYGFYSVFASLCHIPYSVIPLRDDFTIDPASYCAIGKTVVLANPNAPTGLALSVQEIAQIAQSNPDNVIIIDEAYVDFGAESAVPLIKKYPNLLIIGTFSKSRSLAGARLGFCIGQKELIEDLNTIRYAINPYNVNRMTAAAGIAALQQDAYYRENCRIIQENRLWLTQQLQAIGFTVLPSCANFVFAKSDKLAGEALYRALKERGILIRHFDIPRITDYNRITIGTMEQMQALLHEIKEILEVES